MEIPFILTRNLFYFSTQRLRLQLPKFKVLDRTVDLSYPLDHCGIRFERTGKIFYSVGKREIFQVLNTLEESHLRHSIFSPTMTVVCHRTLHIVSSYHILLLLWELLQNS